MEQLKSLKMFLKTKSLDFFQPKKRYLPEKHPGGMIAEALLAALQGDTVS